MTGILKKQINAAAGRISADLVLKNAKVVDVFCHRILKCDVAVSNGKIIGLGEYKGDKEIDVNNKYVVPSFIDAHMHIESTMLTPSRFAEASAPKGVGTVIADPHEIANVCTDKGLEFMLEDAKEIPIDIRYMLPSCVPALPSEHNGGFIDSEKTKELLASQNFYGLGEMMNAFGVINADNEVLKKILCSKIVDGHAPLLTGKDLCAYITAGINTEHECSTVEEMLEKISKGMYVLIREASGAKNLETLVPAVNKHTIRRIMFCTDDVHIDDLIERGSILNCVRKAIKLGIDPIDAVIMSSYNAALCYGLSNKGAIAPGYDADILVIDNLEFENIIQVYKNGILAAENGECLIHAKGCSNINVINTVSLPDLSEEDFKLTFNKNIPVIGVTAGSLITEKLYTDCSDRLNICANIERYGKHGTIGKGFVKGFDIVNGAIAQSIGHDSHNIIVIGSSENDMLRAVHAIDKSGGISVVQNGNVIAKMPLTVAGLMSDKSANEVYNEFAEIKKAVKRICHNKDLEPLMMLSFLSLPVIPSLKLTDQGLFDVDKMRLI